MQNSIDTLLIALLMAMAPEQELPAGLQSTDGFAFAPAIAARQGEADRLAACGQFFDADARRNCEIRIGHARSGSVDVRPPYPETLFWVAPTDPGMPFKFEIKPQR